MRLRSSLRLGSLLLAMTGLWAGPALAATAVSSTAAGRPAESPAQIAARVLPRGAVLAHPPVNVAFGHYRDGVAVLFRAGELARGVSILYVARGADGGPRVIPVHQPADTDELFDTAIRAVLAVPGPAGSGSDLVVLTHVSRPAISGGLEVDTGEVYRLDADDHASAVDEAAARLDGVKNAAEARRRLAHSLDRTSSRTLDARRLQLAAAETGTATDAAADVRADSATGGVREDFVTLPDEVTGLRSAERQTLSAPGSPRLVELDRVNGFLQIAGDGALPGFIVARFRGAQGPVIGLTVYSTVQQRTRFFVRSPTDADGWREVTRDIVPGYDPAKQYTLPHRGTTLIEENADGSGRAVLTWDQHRFERRARNG